MDYYILYINNLILFTNENFFLSLFISFIFIFFYAVISLPGIIIFVATTGFLFGVWYGYIISIIAISFGSFIFFLLSKLLFKYFFLNYYNKINNKINKYISKSTIEYLIIFRMIPGPPLMLQNAILSLLEISYFKFISTTIIGSTPIIFTTVFIGNKINDIKSLENISIDNILTWDLLIILFFIIFVILIRLKYKKNPH